MKNKIRSDALSQGLGAKINAGISPDDISIITINNTHQMVFIMDEVSTISYPYNDKDDLANDFKLVVDILNLVMCSN
tara:strand:+ start:4846 stop:5076 length:231 start_codon:yes stop_codon:yes gene_type:complete